MCACVCVRERKQVGVANFEVRDVDSRKDLDEQVLHFGENIFTGQPSSWHHLSSFQAIIDLEEFY